MQRPKRDQNRANADAGEGHAVAAVRGEAGVPLLQPTAAQAGLIAEEVFGGGCALQTTATLTLADENNVQAVEKAVLRVLRKHDVFRVAIFPGTRVGAADAEKLRWSWAGESADAPCRLSLRRVENLDDFLREDRAVRFGAAKGKASGSLEGPLWRVALVEVAANENALCLVLSVSHAIMDQWGMLALLHSLDVELGREPAENHKHQSSPSAFHDLCRSEGNQRLSRAQTYSDSRFWWGHFHVALLSPRGLLNRETDAEVACLGARLLAERATASGSSTVLSAEDTTNGHDEKRVFRSGWVDVDMGSLRSVAKGLGLGSVNSLLHAACQLACGPSKSLLHAFASSAIVGNSLRVV